MPPRKSRVGGGGGVAPPSPSRRSSTPTQRLPPGLTLTDVACQRWRLGRAIGSGGFGEIYAAARDAAGDASHAVKVEPHASGPLFSEMHCYHRVGRPASIAAWQRARRLRRLGMPRFVGSGSVEHQGERYRFLVMERLGTDLQRLLDRHGGTFPFRTALTIGLQVLDTLEYIHSREYIHADIKAQNLLLGYKRGTENQVYLVDFGLACRYALNGRHKPHHSDRRKAHDGTIEFTSRDAHIGAHSRRGDLEILGYNLLQWTAGRLPWQELLHDADLVAAEKNRHMACVGGLMRACYGEAPPPETEVVHQYLQMVAALEFDTCPDYDALRDMLSAGLGPDDLEPGGARLEFSRAAAASAAAKSSTVSRRRPRSRSGRRHQPPAKRCRRAVSRASSGSGQENSLGRAKRRPSGRGRAPLRLVTDNSVPPPPPPGQPPQPPPDVTSPSLRSDGKLRDFDWQHFNEAVEKAERRMGGQRPSDGGSSGDCSPEPPPPPVYDRPTPAMREVLAKRQQRSPEKGEKGRKRSRNASNSGVPDGAGGGSPVTPAMAAVMAARDRRLAAAAASRLVRTDRPRKGPASARLGRIAERQVPTARPPKAVERQVSSAHGRLAKTVARQTSAPSRLGKTVERQITAVPKSQSPYRVPSRIAKTVERQISARRAKKAGDKSRRVKPLCSPPRRAKLLCSPPRRPTLRASRQLRSTLQCSPQAV